MDRHYSDSATTHWTYDLHCAAHAELPSGQQIVVTLPDQVAVAQREWDRRVIPVRYRGSRHFARLRGDWYGLWTSGTGDPIVELFGEWE